MAKSSAKKNQQNRIKGSSPTGLKSWQKDALSILFLYALVLYLFQPYVVQNKVFTTGGDVSAALSIQKAAQELVSKEGELPLWFPYMFSGMPNFASGMYSDPSSIPVIKYMPYFNPLTYVNLVVNLLFFNRDNSWEVATFFFAGLFMFLLARQLGFSRGIALCAAVGYMFCNFFVASVAAGHGGKVKSIAYIPLVVLTVYRYFNKQSLLNWSFMAFVMGVFFVDPGHTQILYYTFLMLGIYFLFAASDWWSNDRRKLVVCGVGLIGAMLAGLAFGAYNYFSLYVYSDVTMRAMPPALAQAAEMAGNSGMTFDYITMWSFHPLELITFFIPAFFGLESPTYWGWMTFTSSAFYFGVLPMAAAVVGMVYRRNRMTWFLFTTAMIALLISFGRFFEPFFHLMLTILPFFSKFRVPSMILSLFAFAVCLLSCYGLDYIFHPAETEKKSRERFNKIVLYSLIGLGSLTLVGVLFKSQWAGAFSFMAEGDTARYNAGQIAQLKQLRLDLLTSGFVRFVFVAALLIGTVYLFVLKKISAKIALSILLIVSAFDLLTLNKKILRPQSRAGIQQQFQETETIRFLRSDSTRFRIFSLLEHAQSGDPTWTYFGLETIGGYSPAKMRIYQDIIEFALYKGSDPGFPINMNVVNMLNAKYLIANGRLPEGKGFLLTNMDESTKTLVFENKNVLPRAFFVQKTVTERDKARQFELLNSQTFDPSTTAILEEPPSLPLQPSDSTAVQFNEFRTNRISMHVFTRTNSQLVLSEVYYPHGWKAFVDGQETSIFKTNTILRSISVPAGSHEVEFVFEPVEYKLGIWTSSIAFFGLMTTLVVSILVTNRKGLPIV
ncbi:MAG: YfhO family protein [Bacteroidetes bacterium]|nr:YfhO family protein [Bacteroidota bacterium]